MKALTTRTTVVLFQLLPIVFLVSLAPLLVAEEIQATEHQSSIRPERLH